MVTADGQLRRVTAVQDADLFWALRGGGKGRFGVVVAMEIDLHPVTRLYGGGMHFSAEKTAEALHTWAAWTATAPEDMGSSVLLIRMPEVAGVPEQLRGRYLSHLRFAFSGSATDGERLVASFRDLGPLRDTVAEMPYRDVGTIHAEPTTRWPSTPATRCWAPSTPTPSRPSCGTPGPTPARPTLSSCATSVGHCRGPPSFRAR